MKHPRLIIVFSFTLAVVSAVRADLVPTHHTTTASVKAMVPRVAAEEADSQRVRINDSRCGEDLFWPTAHVPDALLVSEPASDDSATQPLPSAPSSATLCLSAFAGFGVWQLTRSARKMHLGSLPEWYHDGGPAQIGHVTPLDLSFDLSALPICHFEAPDPSGDQGPLPSWWLSRTPRHPFSSQFTLLTADPRGPPTL
jgi:hypothetical protein